MKETNHWAMEWIWMLQIKLTFYIPYCLNQICLIWVRNCGIINFRELESKLGWYISFLEIWNCLKLLLVSWSLSNAFGAQRVESLLKPRSSVNIANTEPWEILTWLGFDNCDPVILNLVLHKFDVFLILFQRRASWITFECFLSSLKRFN